MGMDWRAAAIMVKHARRELLKQVTGIALWSKLAEGLAPYVPGEQPRIPGLVKLNTNESPFGPSPKIIEAVRAAAAV